MIIAGRHFVTSLAVLSSLLVVAAGSTIRPQQTRLEQWPICSPILRCRRSWRSRKTR